MGRVSVVHSFDIFHWYGGVGSDPLGRCTAAKVGDMINGQLPLVVKVNIGMCATAGQKILSPVMNTPVSTGMALAYHYQIQDNLTSRVPDNAGGMTAAVAHLP
eukprot:2609249-Ditylum_brightwellii.AAC.3